MESAEQIKAIVREKYGRLASLNEAEASSCCNSNVLAAIGGVFSEDYTTLPGYNPDADLNLGCGLPTQYAGIRPGDVVVDLGSGAGNDAFVARAETGAEGRVIGVDMTSEMIERAERNRARLGLANVEFRLGEIENLPVESATADVVISNCVLNLVPDKAKAYAEIYRILKPGGHFSISDIVTAGEIPPRLRAMAEMYAGCVAGAISKEEYLRVIESAGFTSVSIVREKQIVIPAELIGHLIAAVTPEEVETMQKSKAAIFSLTVYGEKART
ncbi:MAG TPA: arsenite methyltransferase [Blastocatellia bacterium]|nr:arsenite methyltransferase [Blastocatellia bacterium]